MDPNDSELQSKIGKALVTTHDYNKAVVHYRNAVASDPNKAFLRHDLAELYWRLGSYDKAEQVMKEALSQRKQQVRLCGPQSTLPTTGGHSHPLPAFNPQPPCDSPRGCCRSPSDRLTGMAHHLISSLPFLRGGGGGQAATQRNMRREERVTVQGPVKEQQPDGMSHRGSHHRFSEPAWVLVGQRRLIFNRQQWQATTVFRRCARGHVPSTVAVGSSSDNSRCCVTGGRQRYFSVTGRSQDHSFLSPFSFFGSSWRPQLSTADEGMRRGVLRATLHCADAAGVAIQNGNYSYRSCCSDQRRGSPSSGKPKGGGGGGGICTNHRFLHPSILESERYLVLDDPCLERRRHRVAMSLWQSFCFAGGRMW